jgi:rSAM/selenodomain-associated transferase 2
MSATRLSVIIPVIDEADGIEALLAALSPYRNRGAELIVVDGGSQDGTPARARALADHVYAAPRGRAVQMNAGRAVACGSVLLFLHADTRLPDNADTLILDGLAKSRRVWGRFDIRFDRRGLPSLVAGMMNLRSRLTGIATGDQALFVTRVAFDSVGGFPQIALMEDVALSAKLKRISRPLCIRARATTSSRRWRKHGTLRTIFLMWRLRLAYFFGADPARLAQRYGYASAGQ